MLEFRDVIKKYPDTFALNGISVNFEMEKTYLLASPEGHGKTTLMKTASNLVRPDSGVCRIKGKPVSYKTNRYVTFMPVDKFFYDGMTVEQAGRFYRDFYSDFSYTDFKKLLKIMRISPSADISEMFAGTYSKLRLCIALSKKSKIIMIDEPFYKTEFIDHNMMIEALNEFTNPEACLIISCSEVAELECIADDIVVLKKGQIALEGNIEKLRSERGLSLDEIYSNVYAEKDFRKCIMEIANEKSY